MNSESKVPKTMTRIISIEEHFATSAFLEGPGRRSGSYGNLIGEMA